MSDGAPKPGIPAWQRTALTKPTEEPVSSQPASAPPESTEVKVPGEVKVDEDEAAVSSEEPESEPESVPSSDTSPTTAPPAEAIKDKSVAFAASDFKSFQQEQSAPPTTQAPAVQQQAPPIITYPEFLLEAHKPPPLITPARILNTLYAAASAAALLYGASKFIVNPMVDALSHARHDYFEHTQTKVDDFNDRLSKIVTKLPEAKKAGNTPNIEVDEMESVTSDPTELYHRDMGTQTSPLDSPPSVPQVPQRDAVSYQTGGLEILKEHLNEIAAGAERNADAYKERQEKMNKLRHYLDGLVYGSPAMNAWSAESTYTTTTNSNTSTNNEDPIDDLKKEIRGVKGVLLSAKRFPSVQRQVAGTA